MTAIHTPGPRAHYDRRRAAGDRHTAALRNTYNRLLGCLHHCLREGVLYDDVQAFSGAAVAVRTAALPSGQWSAASLERGSSVCCEQLVEGGEGELSVERRPA